MTINSRPSPGDGLAAEAARVVRSVTATVPEVALILGSGLATGVAPHIDEEASFGFEELPGFPRPSVPGHQGRLVIGTMSGVSVAAFFGRVHYYEGHEMDVPALLPRLAAELGARVIIVTAAVGALDPELEAGEVVVVSDHINLMGASPLRGWSYPDGTPAFVPAAEIYAPDAIEAALAACAATGNPSATGVYAAMSGPAYETAAEVGFLRIAGATVVGMSMVPEALPAFALGMKVSGLCLVTNVLGAPVNHADVLDNSTKAAERFGRLLQDLVPRLAS